MLTWILLALMSLTTAATEATSSPARVLTRARRRSTRTRIGTLNCRTLLADDTLTELDTTLTENNLSVCALQEVRRSGLLSRSSENYKIFWFGEHTGRGGVGFAVHNRFVHLVKAVRGVPDSDGRLITMDILIHDSKLPITLICAYSPTNAATKQAREKFYSRLRDVITPQAWLLGDLNARVGRRPASVQDFDVQPSNIIGPCSLKGDTVPNENGALLLDIVSDNHLRHVGSHFACRDSKRWTWRHPRYGSRAVLDHMFMPAPQLRFVCRYIVVPVIALPTDHRLSISELCFRPRLRKPDRTKPVILNRRLLQDRDVRSAFQSEISNILGDTAPEEVSSEDLSSVIRSAPVTAATKVLPRIAKRKYPPEFSAETVQLISRKRESWRLLQRSGQRFTRSKRGAHRALCRDVKKAIADDRNRRLELEAAQLSEAFSVDRFKGYSLLKQQHRKPTNAIMPPEPEFTEHYRNHYQPGPEQPLHIESCELPESVEDDTLSREEFEAGIKKLNENRSPGVDDCAPEYIKRGGPKLLQWLFVFMTRLWLFATPLPSIDSLGRLIPVPKKTSATSVDTTRPICLLTTLNKLYAILVFQKVRDRVKEFVSWTQAGFIKGRSCANNLWIIRRVSERAIEFNIPVYCALVDYKGAFDALNRTTLGRVLSLFLSPSMVRRVLCLYFDARALVSVNGTNGPEFELHRGVRQGCPASPSFFTVALAFISWSYCLTFKGLQLITHHLASLEYADDQILFTLTADGLQEMLNFLVTTAEPFGLRLSPKKCELICFHRPGSVNKSVLPQISVAGEVLKWKTTVVYLGSRLSEDGKTTAAVKHRTCCAESVVERLNERVFRRRSVSARLKGHFMSSAVFSSLLYGLEHCALGARDRRRLDGYYLRLTKRILHLRYDYHLSYAEAEQRLGVERPSQRLARDRLRWIGHALRSEDTALREVLTFIPEGGARRRGRPNLRFYDTLKADLAERDMTLPARSQAEFWDMLCEKTADRVSWQKMVNWRR